MLTLLVALSDGEQHGYALAGRVAELTAQGVRLGPGTLYRTLQRLRVDGLIVEVGADPDAQRADRRAERRRRCAITEAGSAAAARELGHLHALVTSEPARRLLDHARANRDDDGQ
ncbi:MAG: helix-turn-helix transcriptional regulator [Gordonia sp. (in: high G+C Gram-positive bacteria)]